MEDQTNIVEESEPPTKRQIIIRNILIAFLHFCIIAYFIYATIYFAEYQIRECDTLVNNTTIVQPVCGMQFCYGYGLLLLLFVFLYICLAYYKLLKPLFGERIYENCLEPADEWWTRISSTRIATIIILLILFSALTAFIVFRVYERPEKLAALVCPFTFVLLGYIFSTDRKAIKWRTVITGMTVQFLLGVFCMYWAVGRQIFFCIGNKVAQFLFFTNVGSTFVFGNFLIDTFVFAFAILSVIFFFSFFISILYYLGIMQVVLLKIGWVLQSLIGTTVCESLTAGANVFLGMSECPLLIRPYIKLLTTSEIHTVMVSGFATVSGSVMAAYITFGATPANLITASVMAAPGTLALSKLYMPETEESQTSTQTIQFEKSEDHSILDAAANGAANAIPIVLSITANIIAFVAFISFLNAIVSWLGMLVGLDSLDFEWIFGKLFIPLVWSMGVPYEDCDLVAKVVAAKVIINEFVAFQRLGILITSGSIQQDSIGIATFAICGFANPGSLGILIGALSAMAPERRSVITAVALRAFVVGTIVCFISASYAGILFEDKD